MRTKNIGPAWGGQNWRPGKEPGTWFRHSPEYGPIVHYGTYLVILQGKRKLTHEEWLALREKDKIEKSRVATAIEAKRASELLKERAEKQAIIDRLIADTEKVADSPDWRIKHVTSESFKEVEGAQVAPYEKSSWRNSSYYFQDIRWTLYYKGVPVWMWENGCWRPVEVSSENLKKLGVPVEQVSGKCLNLHMLSKHGKDPVTVQVRASVVEPEKWSGGTPCTYPLWITLVGKSYDYLYRVDNGSDPVLDRVLGADPQDTHVGWGWGDD